MTVTENCYCWSVLVSAGQCWGRRGQLHWMSVTVTENCYCWSVLVSAGQCWSVLVSAGVEEDSYSGCL